MRKRMITDDMNVLEKGFTLIELLVVVAILGILAAVAIFAVGNLTGQAKTNACKTEASTVETAAQAAKAQNPQQDFSSTGALVTDGLLTKAPSHEGTGAGTFSYNGTTGTVTDNC